MVFLKNPREAIGCQLKLFQGHEPVVKEKSEYNAQQSQNLGLKHSRIETGNKSVLVQVSCTFRKQFSAGLSKIHVLSPREQFEREKI